MVNVILKTCMENGFLVDKEMLEMFSCLDEVSARELINFLKDMKIGEKVITKTVFIKNVEGLRRLLSGDSYCSFNEKMGIVIDKNIVVSKIEEKIENGRVVILSSPVVSPKKLEVGDFVKHFKARYDQMKKILQARDFENLASIRKIGLNRESYTIIAAIVDKRMTKNKNLVLEVEDPSGRVGVLVNQSKKELFDKAKNLLLDDIVAFSVSGSSEMLFANDVIFPDSYLQDKKRLDRDEWVVFSSDLHVGSKLFLEENVIKFVRWINGEEGDEKQREIAGKIRYLFLVGDNIDGVGVYPDQERLLSIKDIRGQYKRLAEILRMIRNDVKIILCPGQHDGVRVAEPQPVVNEEWSSDLHGIANLTLVSNPALIEIDGEFKVLMYHGASMHSIINEIDELRLNRGHDFPTKVVKEMLKRRHLAPTHGSVVYIPNEKEDQLLISTIPDVVATGDLHRADISSYNNILLVAGSCWQSITPFEEKVGNHPDPCKVPLLNLKTREIKIFDFSGNNNQDLTKINVRGESVGFSQQLFESGGERV